MKEVPIFIASSVREFERERKQISEYLDMLNDAHEKDGVRLKWYRPETMSRALSDGGSQLPYNEKILQSRFFILLVGKELGEHTEEEFNLALEQYKKTGAPLIMPYFLNVRPSMRVLAFQERMRKELPIGEQYVDTYNSLEQILFNLHLELIRGGAFIADEKPVEAETPPPVVTPPAPLPPDVTPEESAPSNVALEDLLEAEQTYQGNLVYFLSLAAGNPDAYEGVAANYYNLGLVKAMRGKLTAAKFYFGQSLSLYNYFPQCESDAQDCRDRLKALEDLEQSGEPDNTDESDVSQAEYLSGLMTGSGIAATIGGLFDAFFGDDE